MRPLLVAAGLGLVLSFPVASAHSLAGISIGDTEAKVLKSLPGSAGAATKEDANLRIVLSAKTSVWICKGAVFSIQNAIGSTLTDYLSVVERETARRGKPLIASGVQKAGAASQGWMHSKWTGRSSDFSIEIRDTGSAHVVSAQLTGEDAC